MKLKELTDMIEKEAGSDPGVQVVFQDMDSGEIFSFKEVTYEFHTDAGGATCFLRGEAF